MAPRRRTQNQSNDCQTSRSLTDTNPATCKHGNRVPAQENVNGNNRLYKALIPPDRAGCSEDNFCHSYGLVTNKFFVTNEFKHHTSQDSGWYDTELAVGIGFMHRNHISTLFENDRHFSHLSSLERELAFRTEMGLYFSYFKTMKDADTLMEGLSCLVFDNVTEYPQTINVLKRFNLYPEVTLGIAFRAYEYVYGLLNWPTKVCWTVNRGKGLPPVQSCEGLGEPSYFYIEAAFLLHGILMSVYFLYGTYISGSLFGGILTVASIFYNHGEATRIQWTPPLRESWSYPFCVMQLFAVTHVLRSSAPSFRHTFLIAFLTVCFMLPWQFAQFSLLTQTIAVFGTYVLNYIGSRKLKIILYGQILGWFVSYLFLFGNEMLLTSFFASCLFTVLLIVKFEPLLEKLRVRLLIWIAQGLMLIGSTVGIKFTLSKFLQVADDKHIADIFRSKFTDYKNFHTMLYTCAAEFDFMDPQTPGKVTKTLLVPSVLVVLCAILYTLLKYEFVEWKNRKSKEPQDKNKKHEPQEKNKKMKIEDRSKPHAELVYHVFQLLAFTMMAVMIMRLKLFWTPFMALTGGLLASRQLFSWIGNKEKHFGILIVLLACMSYQGLLNLQQQWNVIGEFSNVPLEELVDWINTQTPKNAVFAGSMPTMATVKLSTLRPIVNHPHYEDAGLRERVKKVYTMYSRKPVEEVKQNLIDLKVDYAVLEDSWCRRRSRPGCGMAELFDLEDEVNRHKKFPVCFELYKDPSPHFQRVFRNQVYDVLKIVK